ncbi:MAG TPA: hypothetical protein VGN81_20560 [Pseudonocardiaceae bacterium]
MVEKLAEIRPDYQDQQRPCGDTRQRVAGKSAGERRRHRGPFDNNWYVGWWLITDASVST